jgi:hypothetical protein
MSMMFMIQNTFSARGNMKNYNYLALQGWEVNDMKLGSDEEYATQKAYTIYQETKCMIDALKED